MGDIGGKEVKKVFVGSDHAGFEGKNEILKVLKKFGYDFEDIGPFTGEFRVDYPDFAKKVCQNVNETGGSFGILVCGSGTGMAIAANKIKGIRAGFAYDEYGAKMGRIDNNTNVLTLRFREFEIKKYEQIIKTFLETKFSNEKRHVRRIEKLNFL